MKSIRKQFEKEFNERKYSIAENIRNFLFAIVLMAMLMASLTIFESLTRFELIFVAHLAMADIYIIFWILTDKLDNYAVLCFIVCCIGFIPSYNSISNYLVELGSYFFIIFSIGFIWFDWKKETRRVKKC